MQSQTVKTAMEPLAKALAELSFYDPAHDAVIADLYDMVNEIRDNRIIEIEDTIYSIKSEPGYFSDKEKRTMVFNLQGRIRALQGAV